MAEQRNTQNPRRARLLLRHAAGACPYANIRQTCDSFVAGPEFHDTISNQLTDEWIEGRRYMSLELLTKAGFASSAPPQPDRRAHLDNGSTDRLKSTKDHAGPVSYTTPPDSARRGRPLAVFPDVGSSFSGCQYQRCAVTATLGEASVGSTICRASQLYRRNS